MADAYTIARPYAEAVFELAKDHGTFQEWEEALPLMAAISSDERMEKLLTNPRVPQERKEQLFREVAGERMDKEAARLLDTLFANDRVAVLPEIHEIYQALRRSAQGEVHAVITAAQALSAEQQQTIADRLERRLGQKVTVESQVDQSLMAGLVIRAGDLVIDGSVRGGLEQLRNQLKA
ncbi:F0F1 ATP synthase subunit delta [Thiohalorhabdus sp.]|uniref:F0F1 ATP synthase subunit delta n=1 Tax=Thiohalorhabdus sp. TaxID=3094134 RepID=UPI002FC299FD